MRTVYYPRVNVLLTVVLDGLGGEDTKPLAFMPIPRSCSINLNGPHEADTWDMEFDARLLPLDPNIIRSAAVRIYMFAADDLADKRNWAVPEHEILVGLVDDMEFSASGSGQFIHMSGRDYSALLLDQEFDTKKPIPAWRRLSETIQNLVDDSLGGVGNRTLTVVFDSDAREPRAGVSQRVQFKFLSIQPGKNLWDVIYEMCLRHGFIAFVQGEKIIITEPCIQTAKSLAQAPRVAYGTNISLLEVERKFAKERVPQIIVSARDPKTKKLITVKFPKKHETPTTGIGTKRDERQRITPPKGITDLETLERFARTYYENISRSEAKYRFRTKHLEDLGDKDLLRLKPGTPIFIEFDAFNAETVRQLTPQQRVEHLRKLGYSLQLSQLIANRIELLNQFNQPYYIRTITYRIDNAEGLTIEVEAINYVSVIREDRESEGRGKESAA